MVSTTTTGNLERVNRRHADPRRATVAVKLNEFLEEPLNEIQRVWTLRVAGQLNALKRCMRFRVRRRLGLNPFRPFFFFSHSFLNSIQVDPGFNDNYTSEIFSTLSPHPYFSQSVSSLSLRSTRKKNNLHANARSLDRSFQPTSQLPNACLSMQMLSNRSAGSSAGGTRKRPASSFKISSDFATGHDDEGGLSSPSSSQPVTIPSILLQ